VKAALAGAHPARLASDDDFYFKTIKSGRPGTIMPAWAQVE